MAFLIHEPIDPLKQEIDRVIRGIDPLKQGIDPLKQGLVFYASNGHFFFPSFPNGYFFNFSINWVLQLTKKVNESREQEPTSHIFILSKNQEFLELQSPYLCIYCIQNHICCSFIIFLYLNLANT